MGYLGRRIGLSQDSGDSNPGGADGAVGGGILDLFAHGYFEGQGDIYNAPGAAAQGIVATGGVVSDYTQSGAVYRAHVFTSSGVFNVSDIGEYGGVVDYLIVAGGGSGGYEGGGGAGGFRTNVSGHPLATGNPAWTVTATSYAVTVGGGGATGKAFGEMGTNGTDSSVNGIISKGGGRGGKHNTVPSSPGGSGGGSFSSNTAIGYGYNPSTPSPVVPNIPSPHPYGITQGNNGAPNAGGGGGAGGAGASGPGGKGGLGARIDIAGPSADPSPIGTPGPGSGAAATGYLAGGGSGASPANGSVDAGPDGGGGGKGYNTGFSNPEIHGVAGTGGGGGGLWQGNNGALGAGGSGIVVIRYQIASIVGEAKATGGSVSFYGGKTIHTFTNSGTFEAPGTFNETIRYVAVGGGGGGGVQHGGGGGAGGYTTAEIPLNAGGSTVPIAIVIGAGGAGMTSKGSLVGTAGGPENNGNNTTVAFPSPVTAGYGGGGAQLGPPSGNPLGVGANAPLGSGGGGGMKQPGITADNKGTGGPQGNHGGSAITYSGGGVGGGGGGAGAAGGNPSSPNPEKGAGGIGVQVHPVFRDPAAAPTGTTPTEPRFAGERGGGLGTPGPGGQFYLAGGGGGAAHTNWPYSVDSKWGADGGFGGGGHGGNNTPGSETQYHQGTNAVANTGGGGGATGPHEKPAGSGGSGIVLIAYPT